MLDNELDIEPYEKDGYKINGIRYTKIRPVVMGIVEHDNKFLLTEHIHKDKEFYRCIGGGIEFCEYSEDAIKREFKEELGLDIKIANYLGVSENIFFNKGVNCHELIILYEVNLITDKIECEYKILDCEIVAKWVDKVDIISGKKIVFPKLVGGLIKEDYNKVY